MTLRIDPEENELEALRAVTDWRGRQVLEIGCGEGRLTRRLARLGARVAAIDPDAKLIETARAALTTRLARRISFRAGSAERLPFGDGEFDVVVFAWAL
jgi:2-polyprenyl-3-methyl-5-hydroxy-6-metoxy-1,4-benzoquinol methylase